MEPFSSTDPGNIFKIRDIKESTNFKEIFHGNLAASAKKLHLGRSWIFKKGNDSKIVHIHTDLELIYSEIPYSRRERTTDAGLKHYSRRLTLIIQAKI